MPYRFLTEKEPNDGPLLMIDPNTGDRVIADSPRELVAAYLRMPEYMDIQDGETAAYYRYDCLDDLKTYAQLQGKKLIQEIDTSSDKSFLKGLIANGYIALYEVSGSNRLSVSEQAHCSQCVFNQGDSKCSQFEVWADDDGMNCMGFAPPNTDPTELDNGLPALILVKAR